MEYEYLHDKYTGIAVYEILENGDLKGIYTNRDPKIKASIMPEYNKKKSGEGICGRYECSYSGSNGGKFEGELVITLNDSAYDFSWDVIKVGFNSRVLHNGIGIKLNNQIAVSYWQN